jgi:hypothetical protein
MKDSVVARVFIGDQQARYLSLGAEEAVFDPN